MQTPEPTPHNDLYTVGQLRKALEDLDDDQSLVYQTIAADGSAWLMHAQLAKVPGSNNMVVLQLKHPDIKTLPDTSPGEAIGRTIEGIAIDEEQIVIRFAPKDETIPRD